jgi:hypothetical protein
MTTNRFRLKFMFWLDITKSDELFLSELIDNLKQNRLFSSTIRDGIRLICDLRAGRLDVLLTLFPWVEEAFYQRLAGHEPVQDVNLQEQLARLEQLLLQQGNQPIGIAQAGPKQMNVPPIADPRFDDLTDQVVLKKARSDGQAVQNFLDSAFGLQQ